MSNQAALNEKAESIIRTHVMFSIGAGLVPLPLMDFIGVTAIQLDMLRQLARLYGVSFKEDLGKSVISAIGGTTLARIGASAIKAIPGLGSILGGISMAAMSGAMTYGLGQVFVRHFSEGGNLDDIDIKKAKEVYEEEYEKGKDVAKEMEEERKSQKSKPVEEEDVFKKIEKLAKLKSKGLITEEDFTKQKERLLDSL